MESWSGINQVTELPAVMLLESDRCYGLKSQGEKIPMPAGSCQLATEYSNVKLPWGKLPIVDYKYDGYH
jgi:hypothetical protein